MRHFKNIDNHTRSNNKFPVEITETLSKIIRMEASAPGEAVDKVKSLYRKGDIVLDSSDFIDVDFVVKGDNCSQHQEAAVCGGMGTSSDSGAGICAIGAICADDKQKKLIDINIDGIITKDDKQKKLIIINNLCISLSMEIEKNLNIPNSPALLALIKGLSEKCQEYVEL